jgi:hypothetical protein
MKPALAEELRVAQAGIEARPRERALEAPQRGDVHVVVVVVGKEHGVDVRQVLEANPRRPHPRRPQRLQRAASLRPDGVGEEIHPVRLDEHGGVVHERHPHLAQRHAVGRPRPRLRLRGALPLGTCLADKARQVPRPALLAHGRKKALAVEMVAHRPAPGRAGKSATAREQQQRRTAHRTFIASASDRCKHFAAPWYLAGP